MHAQEGHERLNAAVEQILKQDRVLAARVQNLEEAQLVACRSVRFYDDESVQYRPSTATSTHVTKENLGCRYMSLSAAVSWARDANAKFLGLDTSPR